MSVNLNELMDELDFGVIVCADDFETVLFANVWAKLALTASQSAGSKLPPTVSSILREHMETYGQCREFSRAARVSLPDGRRMSLRFRQRSDSQFLIVLTRLKARRMDFFETLNHEFGLTRRECEIAMMVRDGYRNEEIATAMSLAVGTVKAYVHRIFTALEVKSRAELVRFIDRRAHDTTHGA
jgi:DNA-binding NarL/FixJ family response regulator